MEKKLLLIVKEGIVTYARTFDSLWIEKTNPVFPYRNNDAPGNPYARALRLRDHNINRGTQVEVLVLDEDDVRNYYYKRYNSVTKEFSLINETEEERQIRIDEIDTFFGLDQEDYDTIDYMKPDYSVYSDYVSEGMYDGLRTKVRLHEMFSDAEYAEIESKLLGVNSTKRERAIYTIAAHQSRVCIDPVVGKVPLDRDQAHIKATKDKAIEWWGKLIGTQHEKKALLEIARIYSWSEEEDKAVEIYKDMTKGSGLSSDEKKTLRKRIDILGTGRDLFSAAQELYDSGDYDGCVKAIEKFESKATGAVKVFLRYKANELKGLCVIEQAKQADNRIEKDYLKEAALRLLYPERHLSQGEEVEYKKLKKKEKDSRSDRDYFADSE